MFQQLRLMLLKSKKTKKIVLVIGVIVFLVFLFFYSFTTNSISTLGCGIENVSLISEKNHYERTLDPDFCYDLVQKILEYNDRCNLEIELIDCG